MAKGLRSKRMRRNRSELRKQLGEPLEKKRIETVTLAIAQQIHEQRGSSIRALKSALKLGAASDADTNIEVGKTTQKRTRKIIKTPTPATLELNRSDISSIGGLKSRFKFAHP
jgi:hypothetical protein